MDPRHEPALRPEPPRPQQLQHHHHDDDTINHHHTQHHRHDHQQQQQDHPQHARHASRADHDSVISVISPFSPKPSSAPSPSASIASDKRLSLPPRAHLDPEKACYPNDSDSRDPARPEPHAVHDKSEYHEKDPEDKAWQLLFYLSGPCALLSTAITLWTILALLVSLVLLPLRLCTSRPSLAAQITTFLAPALNLQLHLVYSFNDSEGFSPPMLIVIHLFSPIVAFGVAVASWTAAGFWFFSSILGDPGGHDGHNDGKESILGVRNYWERWLSRGLR
jgi:hypothetical protein